MSMDTRSQEEKDALLTLYEKQIEQRTFDIAAIRAFAAEMQASTGDDLGPLIWRDVQRLADRYESAVEVLNRAAFVAEHLWQMVDQETWRSSGAFAEGIYEGEVRADQVRQEIETWKAVA